MYLKQIRGNFHFRITLPLPLPFKPLDITLTLHTKSKRTAESRAYALGTIGRYIKHELNKRKEAISTMLKMGDLRPETIKRVVRDYLKDELETQNRELKEHGPWPEHAFQALLQVIDNYLMHARNALVTGNHAEYFQQTTTKVLNESGIDLDPGSRGFAMYAYDLLRANIRVNEAYRAKLQGELSGHGLHHCLKDLDLESGNIRHIEPGTGGSSAPDPSEPSAPTPEPSSGKTESFGACSTPEPIVTLQELMDQYLERMQWRATTLQTHKSKIKAMLDIFGRDTDIKAITIKDTRRFMQILNMLPPRWSNTYRNGLGAVTVEQLTEANHECTMDSSTVGGYGTFARAVFTWAHDCQMIDRHPLPASILPPPKKDTRELRLRFTDSQLRKLFDKDSILRWTETARIHRPAVHWFWMLWFSLMGTRLEETAALNTEDVFKDEKTGLWCISIHGRNGRKIKPGSERVLPILPVILEQAFKGKTFLAYVDHVRSQGHQKVFHQFNQDPTTGKMGRNFSRAFKKYRTRLGIAGDKHSLHSVRHVSADILYQKLINVEAIEQWHGRKGSNTYTTKTYTNPIVIQTMYDEVGKVLDEEYRRILRV